VKADESPVTAADRACEKLILEGIVRKFPEDGILGEEGANRESQSGRRWIIDPIDGTRDFVRGIPLWAVLIAIEKDGEVVAGVAHSPLQGLLLWAGRGSGAWSNGERVHVSGQTDPGQSVVSFNGFHKEGVERFANHLVTWLQRFWAVRSLGGAVDAMLVAQGRADVWIEPNAAPWDFAPLKILIEEAGGIFKSFDGRKTIYGGNGYACTPALEPYVHELLYSEK
jgi:histidinol-phosphatase